MSNEPHVDLNKLAALALVMTDASDIFGDDESDDVDTSVLREIADDAMADGHPTYEYHLRRCADEIDQLRTTCPPLMGIKEASAHLNMTQQAVRDAWYRSRDGYSNSPMSRRRRAVMFPLPVQMLACGPVWLASQIEQYKRDKEAVANVE